MAQIVITQEGNQIQVQSQLPGAAALLVLAQAIEILRTQVIVTAVQGAPKVQLATTLPGNGAAGVPRPPPGG